MHKKLFQTAVDLRPMEEPASRSRTLARLPAYRIPMKTACAGASGGVGSPGSGGASRYTPASDTDSAHPLGTLAKARYRAYEITFAMAADI